MTTNTTQQQQAQDNAPAITLYPMRQLADFLQYAASDLICRDNWALDFGASVESDEDGNGFLRGKALSAIYEEGKQAIKASSPYNLTNTGQEIGDLAKWTCERFFDSVDAPSLDADYTQRGFADFLAACWQAWAAKNPPIAQGDIAAQVAKEEEEAFIAEQHYIVAADFDTGDGLRFYGGGPDKFIKASRACGLFNELDKALDVAARYKGAFVIAVDLSAGKRLMPQDKHKQAALAAMRPDERQRGFVKALVSV